MPSTSNEANCEPALLASISEPTNSFLQRPPNPPRNGPHRAPFPGARPPRLPLAHTMRRRGLEETPDRNLGFFCIVRLNKRRNIAVHTKVTDATAWPFCHTGSSEGVPCPSHLKQITVGCFPWWHGQRSGECPRASLHIKKCPTPPLCEHCATVMFVQHFPGRP